MGFRRTPGVLAKEVGFELDIFVEASAEASFLAIFLVAGLRVGAETVLLATASETSGVAEPTTLPETVVVS